MLEQFTQQNFRKASLDQIDQANAIIDEYQADGLTLTLRQLYYQFVARGFIENSKCTYKALGERVTDAREAGLISWTAIEDRGRTSLKVRGENNAREVVSDLEQEIIIDPWLDQDFYVEVWIEKDALIGTIEHVCNDYRVTYMACRGFLSASEAWRAGHRFRRAVGLGKHPVVIHLGDHDPSGLDMTRDNETRSSLFAKHHVSVRRIALNMDQVEHYRPPHCFAKMTDTRAAEYIRQFGGKSWELDALEPKVLASLVRDELNRFITDQDAWDAVAEREEAAKTHLRQLHHRWDDVVNFLDMDNGNV